MKKLYNKVNKEELKSIIQESSEKRVTLSFYRYFDIEDPMAFRNNLYSQLEQLGVLGRIYVALEGINAQISVPVENFELFKNLIFNYKHLSGVRLNIAIEDDGKSFFKLSIKIRDKIVADGLDDELIDLSKRGRPLNAEEVNELLDDEETIIVDMRNHYESEVGHFEGAICPDVETFRESLPIVEELLNGKEDSNIIMYCTGGIRCEKASAYYLSKGSSHVHMVEGGIIEYTRQCEKLNLDNRFIGKNFVFDERLGERISNEIIAKCHQCGKPCDQHTNCANDACHILFIQCEACALKFHNTCSKRCAEFIELSEVEQSRLKPLIEFNGSRFGKGRYKALRKDQQLFLE